MVNLKSFGITRKTARLDSGVHLAVFEKKSSPIYTQFTFLGGSKFDPIGKEGLAHFMEHMLVAGTKKFPTKDKLAEYIENYGGEFGASTGSEIMSLNIEVAEKSDFEITVKIADQMINESLFEKKTTEIERKSIHNEIDDWKSNPSRYVWEIWRKVSFQKTKMGRFILGNHKSIDKMGSTDLKSFAAEKLVSSNLSIVISGDIDLDYAKGLIEKELRIEKMEEMRPNKPLPTYREQPILISRNHGRQVHYILGFRSVSRFNEDYEALNIISTALGHGRASILSKELRYKKGLVYTVGAGNNGFSNSGTFVIKTSTNKKNLNETFKIITNEINKINSHGLSPEKLEFAKNKIKKSIIRKMQTSSSWVNFHTLGELIQPNSYLTLDDHINKIISIDNSQIIEVARKYFKKDNWYLAVIGDVKEADIDIVF